jgi:hypothetical protein
MGTDNCRPCGAARRTRYTGFPVLPLEIAYLYVYRFAVYVYD